MAFYYVLLHFWMKLGDSEFFLRSLSVGFSVATVPFLYAVGSRLFGRHAGLIAAWLLAINAYHIRYAQEARAYALAMLLTTISTYLLVRNVDEPQTASWTLYGVCLALLIYSHILGLLIVLAHGAALLCLPSREIPWKGLARSAAWFVGLTLPLVVIIPTILMKFDPLNWVPRLDALTVLNFLIATAGNGGIPLLAISAIVVGMGVLQWLRRRSGYEQQRESWAYLLVLFWFLLPVIVTLVVSSFRPFFVPRLLLPCLPAFVLAVSVGLARLRPQTLAWTLGAAISLLALSGIPPYYHVSAALDDWRAVSASVFARSAPGDEIFFYPRYASVPFDYYRAHQTPVATWPVAFDAAPAAPGDARGLDRNPVANHHEKDQPTTRFWVIFYHERAFTWQVRKNLAANLNLWQRRGWGLREPREFPGVTVLFFAASSPEADPPAALPNLSRMDQASDDADKSENAGVGRK